MVDLSVKLGDLKLDNPIIPASGTFGYGQEYADLYDLNKLGSISIKGITLEPRLGNETPRIAETASGMLNAVGLQNPGLDKVIENEIPNLINIFTKPIIANISGFSIDEYVECSQRLSQIDQIEILEINISCPNVKGGGMSFGTDPKLAAEVTKAVKQVSTKPVYIKLSPNVTDIVEMAKVCEQAGADGISLINTLLGMRIDIKEQRPILKNITGGLSGPAIFPIALRMVYQVYQAVNIPIIGIGGIMKAEDVIEMMLAGASAVQIGAANLIDPWICPKIIDDLAILCEKLNINKLTEIVGKAHVES